MCTHYTSSIPLFLPRFIRLPYLLAKSFLLTIAKHKHFNRFRCTVCKKDFSSNAVLRKHARVHVGDEGGLGNSLQCDLCDYRWLDISVYSSYFYLNTILFQNIWLNTNAISHMISTNTKNGLSLHKRSAHKVIVSKDNTNSTSESENYQLECQHCTRFVFLALHLFEPERNTLLQLLYDLFLLFRRYKNPKNLNRHQKSCTGQLLKLFSCIF